jgi:hypothetical protein
VAYIPPYITDALAAAKERGKNHPDADLWEQVTAIIKRDGDPSNQDACTGGAANEIIELCRKHFVK